MVEIDVSEISDVVGPLIENAEVHEISKKTYIPVKDVKIALRPVVLSYQGKADRGQKISKEVKEIADKCLEEHGFIITVGSPIGAYGQNYILTTE